MKQYAQTDVEVHRLCRGGVAAQSPDGANCPGGLHAGGLPAHHVVFGPVRCARSGPRGLAKAAAISSAAAAAAKDVAKPIVNVTTDPPPTLLIPIPPRPGRCGIAPIGVTRQPTSPPRRQLAGPARRLVSTYCRRGRIVPRGRCDLWHVHRPAASPLTGRLLRAGRGRQPARWLLSVLPPRACGTPSGDGF